MLCPVLDREAPQITGPLMVLQSKGSSADASPAQVILVQNWLDELKRLVPVGH